MAGSQTSGQTSAESQVSSQRCFRCGGLLVRESLFDLFDHAGQMWYWALRCVQCGNVVDSLILKHRTSADRQDPQPAAPTPLVMGPDGQESMMTIHSHLLKGGDES